MINIDLDKIKSEAEWYLQHYNQINSLVVGMAGDNKLKSIKVCDRLIVNPKVVLNAIDLALDSVDSDCRRIALKRYIEGEYWRVTANDECISHQTYYRRLDSVIMSMALQLVAKRIINIY